MPATTAPDLTTYRAVHEALRSAAERMAIASRTLHVRDHRRIEALSRYWRGYAGEVLAHHTIEDDVMFPALVARHPAAAELFARTDAEHHELDRLMDLCAEAIFELGRHDSTCSLDDLSDALDQLARHMADHLDFEDAEILPLFETLFSGEEYTAMEQQAMKSLGLGAQAMFTIPFVVEAADPAVRPQMLADAPAPFRVLYRLTRGRHARLTARALGAPVAAREAVAA